jgi:hypothetical protein
MILPRQRWEGKKAVWWSPADPSLIHSLRRAIVQHFLRRRVVQMPLCPGGNIGRFI